MNYDERNRETEDAQVNQIDEALRHFRESVHDWSAQEYSKARTIKRSRWDALWMAMAHPTLAWTLASALVIASVGVPVTVHRQRQAAAERARMVIQNQKLAEEAAQRQAALAMNDDELLSHVDSDIAQAAPDAMQPLASLMSDTSAQ